MVSTSCEQNGEVDRKMCDVVWSVYEDFRFELFIANRYCILLCYSLLAVCVSHFRSTVYVLQPAEINGRVVVLDTGCA